MLDLIQAEWQKLRRCQILLIGIVALTLCPVVQYGTQLVVAPEYRDATFDFTKLFANVVWGNSQIFLPISLVMLGGWLIDRESASDTLKNIAVIPIPASRLLLAKLLLTALCALLFGGYSVLVTVLTGFLFGLPGFSLSLLFGGGIQILAAAFTSVAATVVSVYLPMVQGFFGTAAVLGADLVPVAIAVLAGPVIMAVLRRVKKLFL